MDYSCQIIQSTWVHCDFKDHPVQMCAKFNVIHLLLELIASNSLINFPFLFLPSKSVTQLHLNVIINLNVKFGDRVKAS